MSDKEAKLCVATMDSGRGPYPVEISFPAGLDRAEKKRIQDALEETTKKLGYKPLWIPVL